MKNKLIKKLMPLCIGLLIFEMIPRICQIGNPSIAEQNKIIEQEFLMLELDKNGLFGETVGHSYDIKDKNGFSYLYAVRKYSIEEDVLIDKIKGIAEKKGWELYVDDFKKEKLKTTAMVFLKSNVRLNLGFKKNKVFIIGIRYRDGVYNP